MRMLTRWLPERNGDAEVRNVWNPRNSASPHSRISNVRSGIQKAKKSFGMPAGTQKIIPGMGWVTVATSPEGGQSLSASHVMHKIPVNRESVVPMTTAEAVDAEAKQIIMRTRTFLLREYNAYMRICNITKVSENIQYKLYE